MNKKAVRNLMENIVYLILAVVFISILIFAIVRTGSQAPLYEQSYSKQIALVINKASVGMEVELDLFDAYRLAGKNKYDGKIIHIDNENNNVNVKLVRGGGYDYNYFNDVSIVWNLINEDEGSGECFGAVRRCLVLKFVDGNQGEVSKNDELEVIESNLEEDKNDE